MTAFVLANGSDDYAAYLPVLILIVIAVGFGATNLALPWIVAWVFGTSRTGKTKELTYESGVNPIGTARKRFNLRFYVLAMTFLVFDVEIVFLYPWATVFPNLARGEASDGMGGLFLVRMLFFIATSVVAYVYAWRKGVFRYD